jgi:toxin secretion/phage lysis holin
METKSAWICVQTIATVIGGWIGWFLGGCDALLYALTAFIVMDYVTGILCAILEKKLSSEIGMRGIMKKVSIFLIVGAAHIVDGIIGNGGVFRSATLIFFISNEGLSLLENTCRIGLPVPPKLKEILSQLHQGKKKKGESQNEDNEKSESE